MADETAYKSGGEKAMEKATVKNEIPAQTEKKKGKDVPERFPDHKSGEDQKKEIPCHYPMKKDLARMIFTDLWIRFGEAEEVFKDV